MVNECPCCGLVNPPEAQRCDCGFDFATRRMDRSYLSPGDVARQADARLPEYVPGGCFTAIMLLLITATNGLGACLVGIAFCVGTGVGEVVGSGVWVHIVTFGTTALLLDLLVRRWNHRPLMDVSRGSQFAGPPVWLLGAGACAIGVGAFFAS
jgi:hypothetical protein